MRKSNASPLSELTPIDSCRGSSVTLRLCSRNQESETHQEVPEGPRAAGQRGLRGWEEILGKGENGVHVQTQLLQDGLCL